MTRKEWTCRLQRRFLDKCVAAIIAIKQAKSRRAKATLMADTFKAWDKRWPHHQPTEEEIEAARAELIPAKGGKPARMRTYEEAKAKVYATICEAKAKAYATICEAKFKQIRVWFQNHTREGSITLKQLEAAARIVVVDSSTKATCSILKLTPKRTLLRWQAFLAIEGKNIRPEIDAAWEKQPGSAAAKKNKWLEFLCGEVTERMDKASPKKLEEVEEYCKSWNPYSQKDKTISDRNARCLAAIPKIDRTLQGATEALSQQTGWASMMVVGSPDPETENRQIKVVLCMQPPITGGKTFEEWLGVEKYEALVQSFVDYVDNVLSGAEGRKEWVYVPEGEELGEGCISDSDDEDNVTRRPMTNGTPININMHDSDDDASDSGGDSSSSSDDEVLTKTKGKTKKSVEKVAPRMSAYELQCEKQIAENKAKLQEVFGTESPSLTLKNGGARKKGTAKGGRCEGESTKGGKSKDEGGKRARKSTHLNGGANAGLVTGDVATGSSANDVIEKAPNGENVVQVMPDGMGIGGFNVDSDLLTSGNADLDASKGLEDVLMEDIISNGEKSDTDSDARKTNTDYSAQKNDTEADSQDDAAPNNDVPKLNVELVAQADHTAPQPNEPKNNMPKPNAELTAQADLTTPKPNEPNTQKNGVPKPNAELAAQTDHSAPKPDAELTAQTDCTAPEPNTPKNDVPKPNVEFTAQADLTTPKPDEPKNGAELTAQMDDTEADKSTKLRTNADPKNNERPTEPTIDQSNHSADGTNSIEAPSKGSAQPGVEADNDESRPPASAIAGMEGGWPVLTSASVDPRWRSLMNAFVVFEIGGPPSGKLNVAGRPGEIKTWIGSRKKAVIPNVSTIDYGARWSKWWELLQPEWRVDEVGGRKGREVPDGGDWVGLNKGGTSGKVSEADDPLWEIVGDVEWALTELAKLPPGTPKPKGKRPSAVMDEAAIVSSPRKHSKTAKALNASGL